MTEKNGFVNDLRGGMRVQICLCAALLLACLLAVPALADVAQGERVLTLPASLKTIEEGAFEGDTSIDQVVLPEGIQTIEARAFAGSSLSHIYLPASLTSIERTAFDGPDKVSITAPKGSLGYAFAMAYGYLLPESEHPYPDNSHDTWYYTHYSEVEGLAITFTVDTEFEDDCDTLTITDAKGLSIRYTGRELSGGTIITQGDHFWLLLESDNGINEYGFKIQSIKPASHAALREWMQTHPFKYKFNDDDTVTIERYWGDDADVVIPDEINGETVASIDPDAFAESQGLTSVTLPRTITSFDPAMFEDMPGLVLHVYHNSEAEHIAAEANLNYEVVDPPLFEYRNDDDNSITIERYLGGDTDVVIPEDIDGYTVVSIDPDTFADSQGLTSVTLPRTITSFDPAIFKNMPSVLLRVYYNSDAEDIALAYSLNYEVVDPPESRLEIYPSDITAMNRTHYSVGEPVEVPIIVTSTRNRLLELRDENGTKLGEWYTEEDSQLDLDSQSWFISYAYNTAGIHRMVFRTSADEEKWYGRADEDEEPLYVAVGNWYDQVTGDPTIHSASTSTRYATMNRPFVFNVQTSRNARRVSAYMEGSKIGTWEAEDFARPYKDRLLWQLPYTFTTAGDGGYVSFEAMSNDGTSGIDSVNRALVEYVQEDCTTAYEGYLDRNLQSISEEYHTDGVGYDSDGYFVKLYDDFTSTTGGSVRGEIVFRARNAEDDLRSIKVRLTPNAKLFGVTCGMTRTLVRSTMREMGWSELDSYSGDEYLLFGKEDLTMEVKFYEDSFYYEGEVAQEIYLERYEE